MTTSIPRKTGATTLVAMFALAVFIHALDRGNSATAAPLIKDQLRLSDTHTGILLSGFFRGVMIRRVEPIAWSAPR
ncbi:MAG: hypothetical protein ACKOPE_07675 [Novosphingobium sp.]